MHNKLVQTELRSHLMVNEIATKDNSGSGRLTLTQVGSKLPPVATTARYYATETVKIETD